MQTEQKRKILYYKIQKHKLITFLKHCSGVFVTIFINVLKINYKYKITNKIK